MFAAEIKLAAKGWVSKDETFIFRGLDFYVFALVI